MEVTENQSITIKAFLPDIDQQFQQVFDLGVKRVDVAGLSEQLERIEEEIEEELEMAEEEEDFQRASELKEVKRKACAASMSMHALAEDDTTDQRYTIEEEKRRIARDLSRLTEDNHIRQAKREYDGAFEEAQDLVESAGNDRDRMALEELGARKKSIETSGDLKRIASETGNLEALAWGIRWRDFRFVAGMFLHFETMVPSMNNQDAAQRMVTLGHKAISNNDLPTLQNVCQQMFHMLSNRQKSDIQGMVGFH